MNRICAFSGHRNLNGLDFDNNLLDRVVLNLIKTGTTEFLCGMAFGFDLLAAESVLSAKKNFNVKLIACLPCANQSDTFSEKNKKNYEIIKVTTKYKLPEYSKEEIEFQKLWKSFFKTIAIKFKYLQAPASIAFLSFLEYSLLQFTQSFQHSSLLSIS